MYVLFNSNKVPRVLEDLWLQGHLAEKMAETGTKPGRPAQPWPASQPPTTIYATSLIHMQRNTLLSTLSYGTVVRQIKGPERPRTWMK